MKSSQIREKFLEYFKQHGHEIVASSSLVPDDPTLLFTNAGMVQFKGTFLGLEPRSYTKATSSQTCVRAGGKHNDLENVGYTARHHTFFEMLGNFSFGDYFKREAIKYAWEFLTKVLHLSPEKLWVTVYKDDDEAADIWLQEMKISPQRFSRCDEDNFWAMGDTGPCGPCSEIFYDHGSHIAGGPPGSPDADGDRYVEIWNLVFMQYNRAADGKLHPLPKLSVDTGMGLERIAAVVQGVHSNYDIDIFRHLIEAIWQLVPHADKTNPSLKVIADHIRSSAFLIADGVLPSNEGRGYVLRRIIRRALRHGNKLGITQHFFSKLLIPLSEVMGDAYPKLLKQQSHISKIILQEEMQFAKTLDYGLQLLEDDLKNIKARQIPGATIFKLYDTYGFPVDLTADIARERGLSLDMQGFEQAMQQQRNLSQAASKFKVDYNQQLELKVSSEFYGYETLELNATINLIFNEESQNTTELHVGSNAAIILDKTPFYAESGGQVGDVGQLVTDSAVFEVHDTQKLGNAIVHYGILIQGSLKLHDKVRAEVNKLKRDNTRCHHSVTHLLHAALGQVLGDHVQQKGSVVTPEKTRFDFSHYSPMTLEQIELTEQLVNAKIRANYQVTTEIMTASEAQNSGAIALFGEKYGENVRVLTMGDFSKELCGGTHVQRTGEIGFFKIISESGIASGVRRIEAVAGEVAINWNQQQQYMLREVCHELRSDEQHLLEKVKLLLKTTKQHERTIEQLQTQLVSSKGADLLDKVTQISGINILVTSITGIEPKALRTTLDQLKNKLESAVIVLVSINQDKINVVAGISKECLGKVPSAKTLVEAICGSGGGRDDMAQGGGKLPDDLAQRLENINKLITEYRNID